MIVLIGLLLTGLRGQATRERRILPLRIYDAKQGGILLGIDWIANRQAARLLSASRPLRYSGLQEVARMATQHTGLLQGLHLEVDGAVARLTLARPEKRNALTLDMLHGLRQALSGLPDAARVVLLRAEGPAFSAGHDLEEMIGRPARFYDELFEVCTVTMETIHRIPQPVIAQVQGPATAAGCQLVASCDLAIASDKAWFATPGVRIGLFCTTPMVPLLRAIGRKRALEMLLTGEPITAQKAADWGLVNRVVPSGELDAAAKHLADEILRWSAETISIGKHAFYAQADLSERAAYGVARPVMADNATTADAQEGMSAFLAKRPPHWTGIHRSLEP
jgi:enoyl-CoA hydratase/carnithine racemase